MITALIIFIARVCCTMLQIRLLSFPSFDGYLAPQGEIRAMVYNYDSLWLHLHVAWLIMHCQGKYGNLDIREAFAKSTDGEECPISTVYRFDEFSALAAEAGFETVFFDAAISVYEASILPRRFEAIMNRQFRSESRRFLTSLTFDGFGYPRFNDRYAGVDGCYLLRPAGMSSSACRSVLT